MGSEVKQKCFVIMPFSKTSEKHTEKYWTDHYEKCLKPLIESGHPLIAERSSPLRGDIVRQIITDLVTASIVVADLTDSNPNVYWELGVRQSFKHGTITIAEYGTTLPFDLGGKGTLFYFPGDHIKMQDFKTQFDKAIDDCLSNPDLPDSQVLETISGRGTLHQILMRDESLRKLDALLSEIENNRSALRHAVGICKNNLKKREAAKKGEAKIDSSQYVTWRFRIIALETFVTNRYIDAEAAFYEQIEDCMDWLVSFSDQLLRWPDNPVGTENWLIETYKDVEKRIEALGALVVEQKKKVQSIL